MTDSGAAADSDVSPEPPRPVDPEDSTLAILRRETRRQGRSGRWTAAFMMGIAVGFVILLAVVVPARFAQAFGFADHHPGVVENVELSPDQPAPGEVRRDGPRWDVYVRWDDQGTVRRGSEPTQAEEQPYRVGEEVEVATTGDGNDVSLRSTGDAWGIRAIILGFFAICIAIASYYWYRSRAWRPLPTLVTRSIPKRVIVQGAPAPHRRRNSRVDVLEKGHLVDYAAVDGSADVGSFLLLRAEHGQVPRADDELDLWSVDIQGPPFAVRRPLDGLWWLGSDSN